MFLTQNIATHIQAQYACMHVCANIALRDNVAQNWISSSRDYLHPNSQILPLTYNFNILVTIFTI